MKPWAREYGSFWVWEALNGLPPRCEARIETHCVEAGPGDFLELAAAMGFAGREQVAERLASQRRCFCLKVDNQIVSYGWVTFGVQAVGELERVFHLPEGEAYIWDCVTLPDWRGRRLYSALLSQSLYRLHDEGVPRIWIGASRLNQPSIRGIQNAGFQHMLDLNYRRWFHLTFLWFRVSNATPPRILSAAYRILLKDNERRWGPVALGLGAYP